MAQIEIENLGIRYKKPNSDETFMALSGITHSIEKGLFVTIVGSSGCGKSSLLMAIAGLTPYTSGSVRINGKPVSGPGPERAVIFQDASLLPWRSVLGNVRFAMEMRRWKGEDLTNRAQRYIDSVGLAGFSDYHPHQLSGGMRQRVNIARALSVDPEVLLMDEPFGALDAQTREIMGEELLRIWSRDRKTVLFVTHSIDEAVFLGDQVIVMGKNPGRIKDVIKIDLPRPRTNAILDSDVFTEYRRVIRHHLADDMASLQRLESVA
ncbi:MAG: sulfonate ABC transporter ATP-binding protein [Burkholderiales bacterium RIFCSPHIGHO2_12_FULL_61_11]|nr:MAG: sulfonate ABC transporter ATP-binding protein [Burkholderiales bacterium RIFCSPHIGHO2_12_FULL_61_11]